MTLRRLIPLTVVALLIAVGYVSLTWVQRDRRAAERRPVVIPELSEVARAGAEAFGLRCAGCHGLDAGGTATGPPLLDPIYRPAHHADVSFQLAVRRGVAAHHWSFGNMAPVPGLNVDELASIIRYVREIQRANGVE